MDSKLSELDNKQIRKVLVDTVQFLNSHCDLKSLDDMKIVNYITDRDMYVTLSLENKQMYLEFENDDSADIVISVSWDMFNKIQFGEINAVFALVSGKFDLLKGSPMQLAVMQKIPISDAYKYALGLTRV